MVTMHGALRGFGWLFLFCLIQWLAVSLALGQGVLLPNWGKPPGELGGLMVGAQVALASGAEAGWYNPAGLAKESRTQVGGGLIGWDVQQLSAGGESEQVFREQPAAFAVSFSAREMGLGESVVVGFQVAKTCCAPTQTKLRVGDSGSLPGLGAAPYSGTVSREITSHFSGELADTRPGLALGVAVTPRFRLGWGVAFSRVSFQQQGETLIGYQGSNGVDTIQGYSHGTLFRRGDAQRIIHSFGFQYDFNSSISLGFAWRLPSGEGKGGGEVQYSQYGRYDMNGGAVSNSYNVFAGEDSASFSLRTPGESTVGMALITNFLIVELDITRRDGLGDYQVFPQAVSRYPSTKVYTLPAALSGGTSTTQVATAAVIPFGEASVITLGVSSAFSSVAQGDGVFTHVDLQRFGGGYSYQEGAFSLSVILGFLSGKSPEALLPQADQTLIASTVTVEEYGAGLGGSWLF